MMKRVEQREGKSLKYFKKDEWTDAAIKNADFKAYQIAIMHDWLRTLTLLASFLIPLFFVLDIFTLPANLLPKFAIYRLTSTVLTIMQFILVLNTKPSKWSYLHGYLLSLHAGGIISLMTMDLGGFSSSYYAGLNLVLIAVNLLMPWREKHTLYTSF
ncbi:MAG: LacI family transcriptional regulator, partial [Bacteroidota bacterium]|nr:LacI family transcriptional regulator [Bacteroidota bacterium]